MAKEVKQAVCGNCKNYKPEKDKKFFNCNSAKHAGLKYGMQVRVDSQACEAFAAK
jgi:hypothetical protein